MAFPRNTTPTRLPTDKIRRLLYGKTILSDADRVVMEEYLKEAPVPEKARASFWNACTGIKAYSDYYCNNYYDTM